MLSSRLRQYGVKSKVVRIGDKTPRGYAREDLHDAWLRYLSPHKPEEAQHPQHPQQTSGNDHFARENVADDVDSEAQLCRNERNTAEDVADSERNSPSERNRNSPIETTSVVDVADVADVRGNGEGADRHELPLIPDPLRRCDHCGRLGRPGEELNAWNWPGRPDGIRLHPACEAAWFDSMKGKEVAQP
jgi:hypothetical protein